MDSINEIVNLIKEKSIFAYHLAKKYFDKYAVIVKEQSIIAYGKVKEYTAKFMGEKAMPMMKNAKGAIVKKYEDSNIDLSFIKKIHFNFHHLTTVSLIALVSFFTTFYTTGYNTAKVDAASMITPEVGAYNSEAIEVNYGDTDKIAAVAKDILKDQVSVVDDPKLIRSNGMNALYEMGDYSVKIAVEESSKTGEAMAKLSIETKTTAEKQDLDKIVVPAASGIDQITEGTTYTYDVKLHLIDTEKPVITLQEDDRTMDDTDAFDFEEVIVSITDNVDGVITDYTVDNMFEKTDDGKWEYGKHIITIRAKDSSGNEATKDMIVRIYQTEEEVDSQTNVSNHSSHSSSNSYSNAGSYGNASSIVAAAYAQLGVHQDCTMLVTNALRAVGIYYHGWPAGYLSLGTVVPASQAQPGDLIYYADGGTGLAHIAVYIGGGNAIHGGWYGYTTAIYSAYVGSGPVFIRLR